MVGLVTENAAAISPADSSRSQIRPRISRRTGEVSAARTFWISRTSPSVRCLACRTRETIRLRLVRSLTNLAVTEQYRSDATVRLLKGRTYGHLADGPRRAQGSRGRPAEPRHRGVGETLAVRRLDGPRRTGPHDLGCEADAARVLRQDYRLRVQLRQGPGKGCRREPGRVPGRHAGQLRVGVDLGEAPAWPDTGLARRDD